LIKNKATLSPFPGSAPKVTLLTAVMFALLGVHECGLTVPDISDEDSPQTLVAYIDCSDDQ
jgi:hypothetical protein